MADSRLVLSVGQCGYDHGRLSAMLSRESGVAVHRADTAREAIDRLSAEHYDLVLVNRVLDADGSAGVELIRALKADADLAAIPVMLVSNLEAAQVQAIEAGAIRGFGKAEIDAAETRERLTAVLAPPPP